MTINELIIYGKKYLHSDQVKLLLATILNKNPLELLTILDMKVEEALVTKFKDSVLAVKNNKPIQYALGNVSFYGYTFKVNENVLIPRFETEELVENTIKYIDMYFKENTKVIDLGTGSGAIGITLKKERPNLDVTLLDISNLALEVSRENAKELEANVSFIKSDMLTNVMGKYDVIISNPPYIKDNEKIDPLVKNNEPHLALYAGPDGLDCYKKILKQVKNHVNDKYMLAFEIGESQREEIIRLIEENLTNVKIISKKDLQGRDRMIFVFHNCE